MPLLVELIVLRLPKGTPAVDAKVGFAPLLRGISSTAFTAISVSHDSSPLYGFCGVVLVFLVGFEVGAISKVWKRPTPPLVNK
jgi:hypothetical protein